MLAVSLALGSAPGAVCAEVVAVIQPASGPGPGADLKPGKFFWDGDAPPSGDVLIAVGLDDQLVHVYRDGVLAGVSTISTGRPGYETPRGVYTILQKKVKHRSNLYDDAPMPFMQRLTWDGLALHAGPLPGYPASHGCIRLPKKFARLLYGATTLGTTVIVAERVFSPDAAADASLYADAALASTDGAPGAAVAGSPTTADLNRAVLDRLNGGRR